MREREKCDFDDILWRIQESETERIQNDFLEKQHLWFVLYVEWFNRVNQPGSTWGHHCVGSQLLPHSLAFFFH